MKKILQDILQNIINIIRIGARILFRKYNVVMIGAVVLFIFMLPAIYADQIQVWQAILGSMVGGALAQMLTPYCP